MVVIRLSACSALLAPSITTPQPWSPPITSSAIRIKDGQNAAVPHSARKGRSGLGGDGNNLAAPVKTAGRAHPVWHVRRRALRAGAQLRQLQNAVISSPHTLAALRRFTLGYAHKV